MILKAGAVWQHKMILKSEDEETAPRPTSFLGFFGLKERTLVTFATGGGIVGNLLLVFHFSSAAKGIARIPVESCDSRLVRFTTPFSVWQHPCPETVASM
jgi:hypothetical protein